jgi:hypothetical protein
MASFTDQISKFNPYVEQLPVETMKQVGLYKQQKYDEGVEKIQGYIDTIAGLDVMHDSDKEYLQSKLNALGNNLKGVAAGDFSNQQLVTSVGGMATQISKDYNVQNAVSSTSWYRKQTEAIEAARKEGKTAASNIDDWEEQVKGWLGKKEAGQVFRGQYSPYRDVNKKIFEAIKLVHSDAQSLDTAYGLDKDGKVDMNNVLAALKRQGIETVDEGKLRTAIGAALDSEDYHQLYIDGKYQLKSTTPEQLMNYATKDYQRSKDYAKAQIERINKDLLTASTATGQARLLESRKHFEEVLGDPAKGIKGTLDQNFEATLQSIKDNPNAARGKIYTKNYIDQFANGYAWANVKDELLNNPVREDYWKAKNYNLAVISEDRDWVKARFDMSIAARTADREDRKEAREEQERLGSSPFFIRSGDPTTDTNTAYANYTASNAKLEDQNNGILNDLAGKSSTLTTKVLPADILKNINNYQDGKYKPKTRYEAQQMEAYIDNQNKLANQKAIHDELQNQATKEITGTTYDGYLKGIIGNRRPITLTDKNGQKVTFSANEVYNYLSKEKATTDVAGDTPVSTIKITEPLTPKEKLLQEKLKNRYLGLPGGDKVLNAYISDFDKVKSQQFKTDKQIALKTAEKLAPITGGFATEQAGIVFAKADDKAKLVTDLTNIAQADLQQKTGALGYVPKNFIAYLTKKPLENVDFQTVRKGDEYFIKAVDKTNPDDVELMPVTKSFVAQNPQLGNKYLNQNTDLADILLRNSGSTNAFKDYKHASYQNGKLGNYDVNGKKTVNIPVVADLEYMGGQLYPVFRFRTKDGNFINVTSFEPTSRKAFEEQYLPSLTDEKLMNLFKSANPNADQLIQR